MQPLDPQVHYGITDREFLDVHDVQMDLLPGKFHQLRWKLNQKAKNEPKFRFYALYDRVYRMDVLEAAWKHVGKKGKASGIDGVKAEDILAAENGVENFLAVLHEELKTKSYRPSPNRPVRGMAKARRKAESSRHYWKMYICTGSIKCSIGMTGHNTGRTPG